jgi:hypothetical protein
LRQCNTTTKSGAFSGRTPDAQKPLNIGENQRSIVAVKIYQCNTTVFFLAERTQRKPQKQRVFVRGRFDEFNTTAILLHSIFA